ncbi:hypothetical protein pb186bvf_005900 [Paramecium bursaria]
MLLTFYSNFFLTNFKSFFWILFGLFFGLFLNKNDFKLFLKFCFKSDYFLFINIEQLFDLTTNSLIGIFLKFLKCIQDFSRLILLLIEIIQLYLLLLWIVIVNEEQSLPKNKRITNSQVVRFISIIIMICANLPILKCYREEIIQVL